MAKRSRTAFIVLALAGVASAAACDLRLDANGAEAQAAVPVVVAQTTQPAPLSPEGPGDLTGAQPATASSASPSATRTEADQPTGDAPPKRPTVAKTQRWVKIFSGPSDRDITPPRSITKGSRTVELNATESDQVGTYVTDGAGRTLYRFDDDSAKPPRSTCNGDCQKAWPPLLIKSPGRIFPDGVDPKTVGYVERADHTCQVTINGWPVYYFIADAKPGDINGQGVGGKWFAIAPSGGKTRAIPGFPLQRN